MSHCFLFDVVANSHVHAVPFRKSNRYMFSLSVALFLLLGVLRMCTALCLFDYFVFAIFATVSLQCEVYVLFAIVITYGMLASHTRCVA